MFLSISITENLNRHFNLLPEIAMFSTRSIDNKLIKAIGSDVEIKFILDINPENASYPTALYHKLILAPSAEFFKCLRQKIISIYFGGDMWKERSEDEKEPFIEETVQELKYSIKLQHENNKFDKWPQFRDCMIKDGV